MRPIAIGKFRKAASQPQPMQVVAPARTEETSRESLWQTEILRRAIAVRKWRGISKLPIRLPAVTS